MEVKDIEEFLTDVARRAFGTRGSERAAKRSCVGPSRRSKRFFLLFQLFLSLFCSQRKSLYLTVRYNPLAPSQIIILQTTARLASCESRENSNLQNEKSFLPFPDSLKSNCDD